MIMAPTPSELWTILALETGLSCVKVIQLKQVDARGHEYQRR